MTNLLDKMEEQLIGVRKTYEEIMKDKKSLDQIECELDFLNEDRLVKVKNNLEIYNEEISRLFLNEGLIVVKRGAQVLSHILFIYSEEREGLVFISKNFMTNCLHGGTFRIIDGELDVVGMVSKKEYNLYEKALGEFAEYIKSDDEDYKVRSMANNLVVDMASILFYIDFLTKYKKEFVTVANRAVEVPQNSKKKKSKGAARKKVNLVKKFTIQTNEIVKYEKEHNHNIYERHVESWTVSGHWRKIKGGKEVTWVSPYTKGKGTKKGKVYTVK